jgi:hypothetical protein
MTTELEQKLKALQEAIGPDLAAQQQVRYKVAPKPTPLVSEAFDRVLASAVRYGTGERDLVAALDALAAQLKPQSTKPTTGLSRLRDDESPAANNHGKRKEVNGPLAFIDDFLLSGPRPDVATKATEPEPTFGDWLMPGLRGRN